MKKRLMAFLLAAVMLVGMLPLTALAEETEHVHDMEYHEKVEPTCTQGSYAYYKCKTCKGIFEDEAGTTPFVGDTKIPAAFKHSYTEKVEGTYVAPKCNEEGRDYTMKCATCEKTQKGKPIAALTHKWEPVDAKKATCTEDGQKKGQVCSLCNGFLDVNETFYAPVNGKNAGFIESPGHKWETIPAAEGNCYSQGHTEYKHCKVCNLEEGYVETGYVHKNAKHEAAVPATCKKAGWIEYWFCPDCSKYFADAACTQELSRYPVDQLVDPKKDHEEKVHVDAQPHTCKEDGWFEFDYYPCCQNPDALKKSAKYVDKADHTAREEIKKTTKATCTTDGEEAGIVCRDCGFFVNAKGVYQGETFGIIEKLGHDWKTVPAAEGNCKAAGHSEYKYCSRCKLEEGYVETGYVHKLEKVESVAATCQKTGVVEHWKCTSTNCKSLFLSEAAAAKNESVAKKDVVTPMLPHTEAVLKGYPATCFVDGKEDGKKCSVCGFVIEEGKVIPATGHTDVDPEDNICDDCGYDLKCKHKNVNQIQVGEPATCEGIGKYDLWQCKKCHKVYAERHLEGWNTYYFHEIIDEDGNGSYATESTIPALGHDMIADGEGKAPSCIEDGYTAKMVCSRCDHVEESAPIEKLGHTDVDPEDGLCDRCLIKLRDVTGVYVVDAKGDGVAHVETPVAGQTLNANIETTHGTIYNYPLNENAYYNWYIDGNLICTDPAYNVTSDNVGKTLKLVVGVTNYNFEAAWEGVVVAAEDPVDPPVEAKIASFEVVDGTDGFTPVKTPAVEQILAANVVTDPEGAEVTYVWGYEGSDAVLGTSSRFTVTSDNVGKVITLTVKVGEDVKTWEAAGAVEAPEAPKPTAKVTIMYTFQNEEGKYTVNPELTETIDAVIGEMYEIPEYKTFEGFVLNEEKTGGKVMVNEDGRNTIIVYYDIVETPVEKANVYDYLNKNLVTVVNCQNHNHEGKQSLVFKNMIHGGTFIKEIDETHSEVIFMTQAYLDAANKTWAAKHTDATMDDGFKMILTWDPETNTWSGAEAFVNIYVNCDAKAPVEPEGPDFGDALAEFVRDNLTVEVKCGNSDHKTSDKYPENPVLLSGIFAFDFAEEGNIAHVYIDTNYLAYTAFGEDHVRENGDVLTFDLEWKDGAWTGLEENIDAKVVVNCEAPVEVAEYFKVTFVDRGKVVKTVEVEKGHTVNNSAFPSVKRDGYYVKWYTEKDGEGRRFKNTTKVNYDMTVYAHWVSADGTNAKTGDTIAIWVTVMLVAAAGFVAVTVFGAKRKRH